MSYQRVLLKLSGEKLAAPDGFGIHSDNITSVAEKIRSVIDEGIQVAVVVGGGNIWRFRDTTELGIERTVSDSMGMMATIMNSIALQSATEKLGIHTRVCSALNIPEVAEPYRKRKAVRHLEKGRVVICAGGTGNPYFTTDSAAALRALELGCDVLLKGTNVDGVYDKDPKEHTDAVRYEALTHQEAIEKRLNVMDTAAFSLCQDQNLPIRVFDFNEEDAFLKAAKGKDVGTLVQD